MSAFALILGMIIGGLISNSYWRNILLTVTTPKVETTEMGKSFAIRICLLEEAKIEPTQLNIGERKYPPVLFMHGNNSLETGCNEVAFLISNGTSSPVVFSAITTNWQK